MQEKYSIICKPEMSTLNNRTGLISGCRHSRKLLLKTALMRRHAPRATPSMNCFLFYVYRREPGEREKLKTWGTMGRRKNGREALPSSHRLPALSIFRLLLFLLEYPAGAFAEERAVAWWHRWWVFCKKHNTLSSKTYSWNTYQSIFYSRSTVKHSYSRWSTPRYTLFFICHFFVMFFHTGESLFTFSCFIHSRLSFIWSSYDNNVFESWKSTAIYLNIKP